MANREALLSYCELDNRICPMPSAWNELWKSLPDRSRIGSVWRPAPPLILAAWDNSSDAEKKNRFLEHLEWADQQGALAEVDKFLRRLSTHEWCLKSGDK